MNDEVVTFSDVESRVRLYVAGAPTSQLSDIDRTQIRRTEIGFVYQSHRLLPEFTALENVMVPGLIQGRPLRLVLLKRWACLSQKV